MEHESGFENGYGAVRHLEGWIVLPFAVVRIVLTQAHSKDLRYFENVLFAVKFLEVDNQLNGEAGGSAIENKVCALWSGKLELPCFSQKCRRAADGRGPYRFQELPAIVIHANRFCRASFGVIVFHGTVRTGTQLHFGEQPALEFPPYLLCKYLCQCP